jgi:predicted ATPase
MALANGGQVLVSRATEQLVGDLLSEGVELADLGEQRLKDLARPERVFQVLHPELPVEFGPLHSYDAYPGNLPSRLTSFVGRERDLERVTQMLEAQRLITLTGTAGVGKTRLALEAAADVVARYPGGVWFCELAGVTDPDGVPGAIGALFDVKPRPDQTVTQAVVDVLRPEELLLILDNCEHLLDAIARLVTQIEQECGAVRVLATSREGLGLDGERILIVASLDAPDVGADLDAIGRSAAVRLFVERAQGVTADFALTPSNADSIAELCRRLDGVALAIELAAARVTAFTPAELLSRLDQRFRVLAGGRRTAVERHQTLRAAIDWSYQLLDERERILLDRLGVFAGGFTLEAAEAITAGGRVDRNEIWDSLDHLVRQSLVVAEADVDETRYRLLESIRQFAAERLGESGDADSLRRAHARYYVSFAETAVPALCGRDEIVWVSRIDRELDNLRAALDWAIDTRDPDLAIRMVSAGCAPSPAYISGFNRMVDPVVEAALQVPGATQHPKYPEALVTAAWLAVNRGDTVVAGRHCGAAEEAAANRGDGADVPFVWVARGATAGLEGNLDGLIAGFERAVELLRARDDPELPTPLAHLANIRWTILNDTTTTIPMAEEALDLARRIGGPHVVAIALATAGTVLADTNPKRALALMREAVELEETRTRGGNAHPLIMAADLERRHGDTDEALRLYDRVLRHSHWSQWGGATAMLHNVLRSIAGLLVDTSPEDAAILLGAAPSASGGVEAEEIELAADKLAAGLGPTAVDELRARGSRMDPDKAVTFAQDAIQRAYVHVQNRPLRSIR